MDGWVTNLGGGEDVGEDLLVALDGLPGAGAQRGAEVAQPAARRQHLPGHHPGHGAVQARSTHPPPPPRP